MSSLAVIVAITVMGSSFGFIGMLVGVPVFAVIIALIKELTDERLIRKGLSAETADYYPRNSMVEPGEEHTTLTNSFVSIFKKIYAKLSKKNTNNEEKDT